MKGEESLVYGIREYWIIDPEMRRACVRLREIVNGVAAWKERVFRGGDVIVGVLFPGLGGKVSELWSSLEDEN